MSSETGHGKNAANAKTLLTYLSAYGGKYAPSNPKIKLAALTTLFSDIDAAIAACGTCKNAYDMESDKRRNDFFPLRELCTRSIKAFRTSDIIPETIKTAESINRKIQSAGNKTDKAPTNPDPDPNADPNPKSISTSQQSFDNRVLKFFELVDLAKQNPNYDPAEPDLKTAALETYAAKLKTSNEAVKAKYVLWTEAMDKRNKLMYSIEVGLVDRTVVVKEYVEQVYGTSSPQAKQCRALKFVRR
jgi:hypothetical protein